jgi:hypothetical protein
MMKYIHPFLCFAAAAFCLYFAVAGKRFYSGGPIPGFPERRPLPAWFGRLWCLAGAALSAYWGFGDLFYGGH